MFLALFLVFVPVVNEKFDKMTRVARAIKEDRASFVLVGTGTVFTFLVAYVVTSSLNDLKLKFFKGSSPQSLLGHRLAARTQRTTLMPRLLVMTSPMVWAAGVPPKRRAPSFSGWLLVSRFPSSGTFLAC